MPAGTLFTLFGGGGGGGGIFMEAPHPGMCSNGVSGSLIHDAVLWRTNNQRSGQIYHTFSPRKAYYSCQVILVGFV